MSVMCIILMSFWTFVGASIDLLSLRLAILELTRLSSPYQLVPYACEWPVKYAPECGVADGDLEYVGFEVLVAVVMIFVIFCDIAPCSPYMNPRFGGKYYIYFQGRKSSQLLARGFPAQLIFFTWRWRRYVLLKRRFIYGLYGSISQKMTTFNP
jgi:hypothetical protein